MDLVSKQLDWAMDVLINEKDSPVYKFINGSCPENDYEYLQLQFSYAEFMYREDTYFNDFILNNYFSKDDVPFRFEVSIRLWSKVRELIEKSAELRLKGMKFIPRLEQYIETYEPCEQENIRKLLIAYLQLLEKESIRENLIDLGKIVSIDSHYLFSLKENHRLFTDKIIELEDSRFSTVTPFLYRDIIKNTVVYKIFAGIDTDDEELVVLHGSSLISLFNLADDNQLLLLAHNDEEYDNDEEDDNEDEDDSIESLINSMQEYQNSILDLEDITDEDDEPHEDGSLAPYKDDLDYLYHEYLWLKSVVELKEARDSLFRYDSEEQRKITMIEQQITKQKRIAEIKVQKTIDQSFHPRLDLFCRKLKLSYDEIMLMKILLVGRIFRLDSGSFLNPKVEDLLEIMHDNPVERVKAKKIFLKQSKLIHSNAIQMESRGFTNDIFDCEVIIDNRLVEYFIGEDYDISNYVEGSMLYRPAIPLAHVVLPEKQKKDLIHIIDHFPAFLRTKKTFEFSSVVEYGNSLVLLFVGPSGTGKTMLANALANHLHKKILLFNLRNNSSLSSVIQQDENVFSLLFREARMNDAILFFDESEGLLSERMNDLLIEIEKHHGMVVFATNAAFTIDEAMRRRINVIQHFQEPGPALRKQIWDIHLPKSITHASDLDLNEIAHRFEINGGLIKNAVFSALAKSSAQNTSEPVITMLHIADAAREQLSNKLFMSDLQEMRTPDKGFESIVLAGDTLDILHELVNMEKAKKVLVGEWGFQEVFPDHNGTTVLFHGPPGTGKTKTAEALAYETGKKLKIIHYAHIVSMWVGETEKALETLFTEACDEDSLLLFDEADALFASRIRVQSANDRFLNTETDVLLQMIERFNSTAVLTTNFLENIDRAFLRRMHYIIEFTKPDRLLRRKLWETLLPPKMPISSAVNFEQLADSYEFTGGDIKNAIIRAATKRAVQTDGSRCVTMEDFESACREINSSIGNIQKPIGFTV